MIKNHPLIKKFISLDLPPEDIAIFGSGPMFAHGLKKLGHDIDAIARNSAWMKACRLGVITKPILGDIKVEFFDGEIEVFNDWLPGQWDINGLIDGAEIIDGIRFVRLEHVLAWKELMHREKDIEHIRLIKQYLDVQVYKY